MSGTTPPVSAVCGREALVEADAVVVAYMRQQTMLRAAAGIPRARRGASGKAEDSAEALAAIERLHEQERRRRGLA
jgi:hypothetical protein